MSKQTDDLNFQIGLLKAQLYEAVEGKSKAEKSLADIEEYGTEEINAAVKLRSLLAKALCERDEAREWLRELLTEFHEYAPGRWHAPATDDETIKQARKAAGIPQ